MVEAIKKQLTVFAVLFECQNLRVNAVGHVEVQMVKKNKWQNNWTSTH